jgi:tetratricopeptide (TPR) repeat protein
MRPIFLFLFFCFAVSGSTQNDANAIAKKYLVSGEDYRSKDDYKNAIKDYSKALEYRSQISDAYLLCKLYLGRALSRLSLGSQDALSDATQAVTVKPEYAQTYYVRSLVYLFLHEPDKALQDLDSASSLKPGELSYLFLKSTCYREKKMPEEGLKVANKILEIDPKSIDGLQERGSIHLEMHNYELAVADFRKVLEYEPTNFGALCNIASCLSELKKFEEAQDYYLKALATDSSQGFVIYNNIGYFINLEEKNYEKAIVNFDKAIRQNPRFGFSYSNRGYARMMLGDLKTAMKDVNKAIELDPKNSFAYKNRALVLIADKRISSACLDLQKALQLGYAKQYDNEVDELIKKHCGK